MILLTDASKQFKEQLTQNLDIRVKLFTGRAGGGALASSLASGTGIVTLDAAVPGREYWVKRLVPVWPFKPIRDITVYYSHDGVTFHLWHVFVAASQPSPVLDLPVAVLCGYVKLVEVDEDGVEVVCVTSVAVYEEGWFDLSAFVRDGVTVERAMDRELGVYTMQHASVPLDNTQRYFSKRNSASPFWDATLGVHHCRANAKFLIEVMYRGNDGRIPETGDGRPEWIPLVTFFAERFSSNPEVKQVTASGSSGKILLKSKTTQPLYEIMTPLELIRDGLLRSDDDNSLLMPLNPAARQKTESVYSEYVGQARTFGSNWRNLVSLDDSGIIAIAHPSSPAHDQDNEWFQNNAPDGRHRFGMCTDGSFVYSILCEKVGLLLEWYLEKMSFAGEVLQARGIGSFSSYVQDLAVDDEYVYWVDNFFDGFVDVAFIVKVPKADLSAAVTVVKQFNALTTEINLYGITHLPPSVTYPDGVLFVFGYRNEGSTGPRLLLVNPVTGAVTEAAVTGAPIWMEYIDAVDEGRIVGHSSQASQNTNVYEWKLSDGASFWDNRKTHALTLADYGAAVFSDRRKFIFLVRHNLGFAQVAEFGFFLENGNVQYAGAPGFCETINFPQPEIRRDGQLLDRTGVVASGILTTDDYILNLATGELQTRALQPDGTRFTAGYDYKYSLQYVRIEKMNRLEALSNVAISNNFVVYANGTNELQFRDRRYEELIVCSDGTTVPPAPVADKRLGDTYLAGGLPYIVHDSNVVYAPFKTIKVCGVDRVREFIESVDFTIAYTAGRHYITFLDTEKVHESKSAIVRYHVQQEIPILKDARHIVQGGVDDQWGDSQLINDVTVTGEKMFPQDTSITAEQIFAVSPNEAKQSSRYANFQENRPEGLFNWDPATKVVDDDSLPDAQRKYLIEFDSPLVLGTTGFEVVYGDARNGGDGAGEGHYGILVSGAQAHNGSATTARFYKITFGSGGTFLARDTLYNVMVDNNREWRLATSADYADMLGNSGGFDPSSANDVKTTAHFYLKQMNGNYGQKPVNYIAYYTRVVRYFLDRYGRVMEDATFDPSDPGKNPVKTVSPSKRIAITLTPEDERQNPLFPLHNVSGKPGYQGSETPPTGFNYWTGVLQEFSLRIRRLEADMLGVNFDYDSWSAVTNFVRVATTGFPLTVIERFIGRAPASPEDLELYGLREKAIDNTSIQNIGAARNLARSVKSLRGNESEEFGVEVIADVSLTEETLVRVVETFSGIDELFTIVKLSHRVNVSGPSTSRLGLETVE